MLLQDKVCLVTGGGSGIGRATSLALAHEGASVAVADLNLESARATVGAIEAAGGSAMAIAVDVADEASVDAMVDTVMSEYGALDGAFNNAGVGSSATGTAGLRAADIPRRGWDMMIGVNLTGVWLCMKAELKVMKPGAAIVNTASILGTLGTANGASYVAAKHGVVGLTKAAALDYAADNIRINAICPGYIDTPILSHRSAEQRQAVIDLKPMGRFGRAQEIADAVVWLLSSRSSYATGTSIIVDGGYTAR